MAVKPESQSEDIPRTPAPGVGDPVRQDDNTSLRDGNIGVPIVSGPNGNQGGN